MICRKIEAARGSGQEIFMTGYFVNSSIKFIHQSFSLILSFPRFSLLSLRGGGALGKANEAMPRLSPSPLMGEGWGEGVIARPEAEAILPCIRPFLFLSFPRCFERESRKKFSFFLVLFFLLIIPSLSFASCCVDFDGDGYSDPKTCRSGTDCDDNNKFIYPGTPGCNNCKDVDDDGYFANDPVDCSLGNDCDDANAEVNPGKGNCGGNGDGGGGGCIAKTWHKDYDEDKYSDGTALTQCIQPYKYVLASELTATTGDCEDDPSTEPDAFGIHPGAVEVCDEKDNNCDGTMDEGCCEGDVSLTPAWVYPVGTYMPNEAVITATLIKAAPPDGCHVSLTVTPINLSGGHIHYDGRPTGKIIDTDQTPDGFITFPYGEAGAKTAKYISSEVSGNEKINAYWMESGKIVELGIDIKVPDLMSLGISGQGCWNLVGSHGEPGVTSLHYDNHYGTSSTIARVAAMACDYYENTNIAIDINDLSLERGGVFDIENNWKKPHSLHRKGKSVDVNHRGVKEKLLDKLAEKDYGCSRREKDIGKIHYECP